MQTKIRILTVQSMEKPEQMQNIIFLMYVQRWNFIVIIARPKHQEWQKVYINIHIRTPETKIKILNIETHEKIGMNVEYGISFVN